jgi:hypothetical protein
VTKKVVGVFVRFGLHFDPASVKPGDNEEYNTTLFKSRCLIALKKKYSFDLPLETGISFNWPMPYL